MTVQPHKAYIIRWSIANDMEAIVYAESAADSLRRFDEGEIAFMENTGNDWRCRKPRSTRLPTEDRKQSVDPVCALHGMRWSEHDGGRCLYCCICYKPLTPEECAVDADGSKWDVCDGACAVEAGIRKELSDDAS